MEHAATGLRRTTPARARAIIAAGVLGPLTTFTTSALAVGGDDAVTATVITALPFADTGDTTTLTDQFDVVCPFTGSTAPDAWYVYESDENQVLTVSLCASAYDTKTYVLDADFTEVACNDDACTSPSGGQFRSLVDDAVVEAGTLVYIVVDGWSGDAGIYDLSVTGEPFVGPCTIADDCEGIDEAEPCAEGVIDMINGGCNSSPEVFSQAKCGDTVCGTAWALDGTRDTDWYELPFPTEPTLTTGTLVSEFDATLIAVCADCSALCINPFVTVGACETGVLPINSERTFGVWWFVGSIGFDGLPCTGTPLQGNDYVLSWTCGPIPCPTLGDVDGDTDVDFADLLTILANWGDCP